MTAQEGVDAIVDTTIKASRQRIARLAQELRARFPNVPRTKSKREFPKVSQHLTAFRENVSRLADRIQDEDRARLLEPTGPKVLRGRPSIRRPRTAIISHAARAAYERRMAREKLSDALFSLSTRRSA